MGATAPDVLVTTSRGHQSSTSSDRGHAAPCLLQRRHRSPGVWRGCVAHHQRTRQEVGEVSYKHRKPSPTVHDRTSPRISITDGEPRADRRSSRHSARRCGGYLVVCGSLLRTFHLTSSPDCKSACWSGVGWRRGTSRRRRPWTLSMFGHWRISSSSAPPRTCSRALSLGNAW